MGFDSDKVRAVLFKDFVMHYEGYQRRQEEKWDMVRHQMWATISFGGMGLKHPISVQDVIKLPKDKPQKKTYISNKAQALQFLNNF